MSVQRGDRVEIGQPIGVLLGQDEWAHVHMTVKQSNDQPEIWLCPMDFMVAEERDELLEPTQVWADRLYNGSKTPLCNDDPCARTGVRNFHLHLPACILSVP